MLNSEELIRIAQQASNEILKNNFGVYFKNFAFPTLNKNKKYQHSWAIDCMCEYATACYNKDIKKLIVNIPPRQGKSMLWSTALPSFVLGHRPEEKIYNISNTMNLSTRDVRNTKILLNDNQYKSMFQNTIVSKDTEDYFSTTMGGERKAFSSMGQITGQGANYIILDDFMSVVMYDSEAERRRALRFFIEGISSRLDDEMNDVMIVVEQRLGMEDLSGYLLENSNRWEHLCLPAEFTEKKYFYIGNFKKTVNKGDLLNEKRLPKALLEEKRNARSITFDDGTERANSSQYFEAQYMQNPVAPDGNLIKWDWFREFDLGEKYEMNFDYVLVSTDAAAKTKKTNDPSAFVKLGVIKNQIYVLDIYNKRRKYHETKENLINFSTIYPTANDIIIEDASTGQVLITELKRESGFGIFAKSTKGLSKEMRARNETGQMANGNIFIPEKVNWLHEFRDQIMQFPNGKHDDIVDAFVYGLAHIRENQSINYNNLFMIF